MPAFQEDHSSLEELLEDSLPFATVVYDAKSRPDLKMKTHKGGAGVQNVTHVQ